MAKKKRAKKNKRKGYGRSRGGEERPMYLQKQIEKFRRALKKKAPAKKAASPAKKTPAVAAPDDHVPDYAGNIRNEIFNSMASGAALAGQYFGGQY